MPELKKTNLKNYKTLLSKNWDLPSDLTNYLLTNGFKLLGEGGFSAVFGRAGDNIVVKVNKGVFDKSFVEFINFCKNNRNNKHLPKCGKIRYGRNDKGEDFYYLLLERLKPLQHEEVDHYVDYYLYLLESDAGDDTKQKFLEEAAGKLSKDEINQVIEISEILLKCINSTDANLSVDMKASNLMLRGSTIVITDPFES